MYGSLIRPFHPHHQHEDILHLVRKNFEPARVINCRGRVVNRARPDNYEQARVAAIHDLLHDTPIVDDIGFGRCGAGNLRFDFRRRRQQLLGRDVNVVSAVIHDHK